MLYLILGILAFLYLCSFSTWEHMTNSDVQKKQEHHKTATTWDSVHKKKTEPEEAKLKGPQTSVLSDSEKEAPKALPSQTKTVDYPEVYGPDLQLVPGHKDSHSSSMSNTESNSYDFLPAAEFPSGPQAPQPFLTDFSKIMK
jgi:hypothetical protein